MKTFVAFLILPVIFFLCLLAMKCYLSGQYFLAYTLVAGWFASFVIWIDNVGEMLQTPAVSTPTVPRVPRAYIAGAKNR